MRSKRIFIKFKNIFSHSSSKGGNSEEETNSNGGDHFVDCVLPAASDDVKFDEEFEEDHKTNGVESDEKKKEEILCESDEWVSCFILLILIANLFSKSINKNSLQNIRTLFSEKTLTSEEIIESPDVVKKLAQSPDEVITNLSPTTVVPVENGSAWKNRRTFLYF